MTEQTKVFCPKHERFYEQGASCDYCVPEPANAEALAIVVDQNQGLPTFRKLSSPDGIEEVAQELNQAAAVQLQQNEATVAAEKFWNTKLDPRPTLLHNAHQTQREIDECKLCTPFKEWSYSMNVDVDPALGPSEYRIEPRFDWSREQSRNAPPADLRRQHEYRVRTLDGLYACTHCGYSLAMIRTYDGGVSCWDLQELRDRKERDWRMLEAQRKRNRDGNYQPKQRRDRLIDPFIPWGFDRTPKPAPQPTVAAMLRELYDDFQAMQENLKGLVAKLSSIAIYLPPDAPAASPMEEAPPSEKPPRDCEQPR